MMFGLRDGGKGGMSGIEYDSYLSFQLETSGNNAYV